MHKILPTNDYLLNRAVLKVFNSFFLVTTTLKRQFRQFANSSTNSNKSLFLRKISSLKKLQKIDFIFKKKSKCFSRYLKCIINSLSCLHINVPINKYSTGGCLLIDIKIAITVLAILIDNLFVINM